MAIPVKALLAGTATIGVGATGIWMMSYLNMPEWRSLDQDQEFWNNSNINDNYKGKYSEKYSRFLVGVGTAKATGESDVDNASWWDWSFKNRYQTKTDKDNGFGSELSDASKLKAECANAYKATVDTSTQKISFTPNGGSAKEYSEEHIWLFCSPLGAKPILLKESKETSESEYKTSNDSSGKWGQHSSVNGELISVESDKNDSFWAIQQRDLGENIDTKHKFFTTKKKDGSDIRETCKDAYAAIKTTDSNSETTSSESAPSKEELLKYCSLGQTATTVSSGG